MSKSNLSEKCQAFLDNKSKFEWFIEDYFGAEKVAQLTELAKSNEESKLLDELGDIWFRLPDGKFNIIENPMGWSEFLEIIEE